MDQGTAEAIAVIEKQMAEMNQKIAQLKDGWVATAAALKMDDVRIEKLERAALAFMEGFGK